MMLKDQQILALAEPFGAFEFGDAQGHKRLAFARAVITACLGVQSRVDTLRDHVALEALKSMLNGAQLMHDPLKIAPAAYAMADQMICARNAAQAADPLRKPMKDRDVRTLSTVCYRDINADIPLEDFRRIVKLVEGFHIILEEA